jgi:hypothetical protein
METKTDVIRKLLKNGILSDEEIAARVDSKIGYVRSIKSDMKKAARKKIGFRSDQKKWRKRNTEKRNEDRRRNYEKGSGNKSNSGQTYSARDHSIVFDSKMSDREKSKILGRTVRGIQLYRCRANRIDISEKIAYSN